MNDYEAKQCHEAMLKFLKKQGDEKAAAITKGADEEFRHQKALYIEEEKARVMAEYKARLA